MNRASDAPCKRVVPGNMTAIPSSPFPWSLPRVRRAARLDYRRGSAAAARCPLGRAVMWSGLRWTPFQGPVPAVDRQIGLRGTGSGRCCSTGSTRYWFFISSPRRAARRCSGGGHPALEGIMYRLRHRPSSGALASAVLRARRIHSSTVEANRTRERPPQHAPRGRRLGAQVQAGAKLTTQEIQTRQ